MNRGGGRMVEEEEEDDAETETKIKTEIKTKTKAECANPIAIERKMHTMSIRAFFAAGR